MSRFALLAVWAMALAPAAAGARSHRKRRSTSAPASTTAPPAPTPDVKEQAAEEAAKAAERRPQPSVPALLAVPLSLEPGGEQEALLLGYLAEGAIRRAARQQPLSLADRLDPSAAEARRKAGQEGMANLAAARRAYDQIDFEVAAALCDRAAAAFLEGDLTRHFPDLVSAWELKIAILAADPAKQDQVKAELSRLLPVDPRGELSPNLFNPDVIHLADGIRRQVRAASTLSLQVKTTPAPAEVFVDGAFRGVSPLTIKNLPPGDHFVTLIAPGFHPLQRQFDPNQGPELDATLEPAELAPTYHPSIEALRRGFHRSELAQVAAALGSRLGADQVLVLGAEKQGEGTLAQVVRVNVKDAVVWADLEDRLPDGPARLASAADALITRTVSTDRHIQSHRVEPPSALPSLRPMQIAGFGLVGGGIASGGAGLAFGLSARGDERRYASTPQTDTALSNQLAASGKRDAVVANLLFGTAVVATVTGAVLVYLDHRSSPGAAPRDEAAPLPESTPRIKPAPAEHAASGARPVPPAPTHAPSPSPAVAPSTTPTSTTPPSAPAASPTKRDEAKPAEKPSAPHPPADTWDKRSAPPKDLGEDIKDDQ